MEVVLVIRWRSYGGGCGVYGGGSYVVGRTVQLELTVRSWVCCPYGVEVVDRTRWRLLTIWEGCVVIRV